ncbi:hypothetical protein CC265_002192 [Escherichia coli]|nr:hypothetical protein [Escherichia coli]
MDEQWGYVGTKSRQRWLFYARDATFLKINEDRPGAPIFKGWTDNSFSMSTNFDEFRR